MVSWFIAACQFGGIQAHLISSKVPASPREWSDYSRQLGGNVKERIAAGGKRKELQERLISFCFSPTGWSNYVRLTNARSEVLCILLRKIFGSPRCSVNLRQVAGYGETNLLSYDEYTRLTEEVLDDNSPSAAKAMEGLLFSRLAPLLVLRMLPRGVFGSTRAKILSVDDSDSEAISEVKMGVTSEVLFHCLARSVVDPLEFKEVKMLATECLSKFPPPLVLPFVFAYVVAFLREATLQGEQCSSLVVEEDSVPDSCGLVTAKLMVYYLNRIFSEDEHAYKDCDISSKALVLLVQVLAIESDDALVTDLQRGCIDCIALILSRLAANDSGQEAKKVPTASASSLMNMLITWIFGIQNGEDCIITQDVDGIDSRVQRLFERMWSQARYDQLPLQVRICCCNVLLSAISRSENSGLASWKAQGFISRIALATDSCSEESVVAGGLQIIFSFLHKASDFFSIEDNGDLQLVRMCFETTAARLESTRSESIAMNGLKVVGALIGKLPGFMETLSSEDLQQLIDRCLITVRDRQVSPVVTELAQSLLQAMTPP
ncbi:Armadillo-type fold [Phytophthora cactorum]|nr:Armadillo-type fold [Phytophthora cactorum]